ncbi:MAG: hypothetical protein AAGA26_11625 [Pseudomonadota bacterium]
MSETEKKATEIKDETLDDVAGGLTEEVTLNYAKVEWTYGTDSAKVSKPKPKGMERVFDDE